MMGTSPACIPGLSNATGAQMRLQALITKCSRELGGQEGAAVATSSTS